jgi:hypothetical protein
MLYAVGGSGDAARGSHVMGVCLLFGRLRPEICLPELAPRLPVRPSWAAAAERRSVPFPSAVALAVLCKRRC